MLKALLYADLERQMELNGFPGAKASVFIFLRRLLHPRFLPIVIYRCSRSALLLGIPALSHLLSYLNQIIFGIEISPKCSIGPGIFFPHTSGTVIGASNMGSNVIIFQGVTLGAKEMDMGFDEALRPQIGNNVVVGAGAKVLGGICLGDNVRVGANSVLLRSVPANSTVAGVPAREVFSE
jgi:serine O-acetyltransferase